MRPFVGDGSFPVRIKASPSEDMEIRTALGPFCGDGVISPSLLTIASPSKDNDILSDGGDLVSLNSGPYVVPETSSELEPSS